MKRLTQTQPLVFELMKKQGGPMSTQEVATTLGIKLQQAGNALFNLKAKGAIKLVGKAEGTMGLWEHDPRVQDLSELKRKNAASNAPKRPYTKKQSKALAKGRKKLQSNSDAQVRFDDAIFGVIAAQEAMVAAYRELEAAYDGLAPYIMSEKDRVVRDHMVQLYEKLDLKAR